MTHVKKPLCFKCQETAAGGCKLGFCGRHCWPRCDEQVHNRRTVARGREGQPRRDLTRELWKEASDLAGHYIVKNLFEGCRRAKCLSWEQARRIITGALLELVRDPDLDPLDDRIPDLLRSSIPPGDVDTVVSKLRSVKPVQDFSSGAWWSTASASKAEDAWVSDVAATKMDSMDEAKPSFLGVRESGDSLEKMADVADSPSFAVATSSTASACGPWQYNCHLLPYDPQNQPALDKHGKPSSHYRRAWPPKVDIITFPRTFGQHSRHHAHAVGRKILQEWISLRPELAAKLHPMVARPFMWYDSKNDGAPSPDIHDTGDWVYFALKKEVPLYPEGTKTLLEGRPQLGGKLFVEAVHCCSMYTLMSSVCNGVQPGPEPGKGGLIGVYAYKTTSKASCAKGSSGYCTYESLCSCGHNIFFGLRLMLEVQDWRIGEPGIGKVCAGEGQWCLKPGMFHLRGFFIHIMTPEDIDALIDPDNAELWLWAGRWSPRYEVGPDLIEV